MAAIFRAIEPDVTEIIHQAIDSFREDPSAEVVNEAARVVRDDIDEITGNLGFHRTIFSDSLGQMLDLIDRGRGPRDMSVEDAGDAIRSSRRMLAPTFSALRGARETLNALRISPTRARLLSV